MLPRVNRLTKNKEFERVFEGGRRIESGFFRVQFLKNQSGAVRTGVICGTKIAKKATARNRIKRRLRAVLRLHLRELAGLDLIVVVKPAIRDKSFAEITQALEKVIDKITK